MKNILVGIDFHEKTADLVDYAYQLAAHFKSKIWLVHIAAPDPDFVGYEVGPQYIRDSRADTLKTEHQQLIKFADDLKSKGIEAEGLLIQGPTIDTIIAESQKLKIDLIITGHHEHSFIYEVLFGNTSNKLIDKSSIPVLVIPLKAKNK